MQIKKKTFLSFVGNFVKSEFFNLSRSSITLLLKPLALSLYVYSFNGDECFPLLMFDASSASHKDGLSDRWSRLLLIFSSWSRFYFNSGIDNGVFFTFLSHNAFFLLVVFHSILNYPGTLSPGISFALNRRQNFF